MSDSVKAVRAIVPLGAIEVEGFMLPDGEYLRAGVSHLPAIQVGSCTTVFVGDRSGRGQWCI
jgi:hypothetical protein